MYLNTELKKITCMCGETVFEDEHMLSDNTTIYQYACFTCTKCGKKWWVRVWP